MGVMAKKKGSADEGDKPKRFPSRDRVRYVGVPLDLDELLTKYAEAHSTIDDQKSKNWAARVLLRKALAAEGYTAPKMKGGGEE